ncbi:MAG: hypothetical protein PHV18_14920 [Lachnospiraceae bacterium]|nr:hypothetical protein [Lachnospiraceae bacterium]
MTISGFVAYVKQIWANKPSTSSPLSADRLNHMEGGIKGNSDAINAIAAAVVNQIVNDPNKIASMAALYSVKQELDTTNSNFKNLITPIVLTPSTNVSSSIYTCIKIGNYIIGSIQATITGVTVSGWTKLFNFSPDQTFDHNSAFALVSGQLVVDGSVSSGSKDIRGFLAENCNGKYFSATFIVQTK